jgi:hypothetical protein
MTLRGSVLPVEKLVRVDDALAGRSEPWRVCAGRVPHAIRMRSVFSVDVPPSPLDSSIVYGSRKRAPPWSVATWLRASCERTTSISRAMTFWTRNARSATVTSLRSV